MRIIKHENERDFMRITDLMVDETAIADGVWFEVTEDFAIKVRSLECKEFAEMFKRLMKPYENLKRQGRDVPEDKALDIIQRCVAETILLDWRGLLDAKDKPIPYSKEKAHELIKTARDFADIVTAAARERANFRVQAKQAATKNSVTS